MKKIFFVLVIFLGLPIHIVIAAESETSFGVGVGALYSGFGVNVGIRSESDFKYIATGCLSAGYSSTMGWNYVCGIGAGWIWTGLFSKDDNRHGFGLYVGPSGVDKRGFFHGKARYGLGVTYIYFMNGLSANNWNFGITPAVHTENGNNKGSIFFNAGYQF